MYDRAFPCITLCPPPAMDGGKFHVEAIYSRIVVYRGRAEAAQSVIEFVSSKDQSCH